MSQEENKKYRDIMKTSKELFWKHGFRRVTVEEICKKAGVSKMTYYRFFSNKFENAKAVFEEAVDKGIKTWREILEADTTSAEKVKQIIFFKIESTNEISKEFVEDFYLGSQPELKVYVEEKTRNTWNSLIEDFRIAQKKGFFRDDFKPEFLFHISNKFTDLMNDNSLSQYYESTQDMIMEFVNFFAYGISKHDIK